MKALMKNSGGIADKLKSGLYAEPALVPESPWLGEESPGKPVISAKRIGDGVLVQIKKGARKAPWQWLVRMKTADGWTTKILPGQDSEVKIALPSGTNVEAVAVSGVSRLSREGDAARAKVAKSD